MSPLDSRHGKYAGYMAGCKCSACMLANRRYDKLHALRALHGPVTVPIDRAAAHITACLALGMKYDAFEAAGVARPSRIHRREHRFLHATTERKVLAVQPTAGRNWFPRRGVERRLRALIALGHRQAVIAEKVGITAQHMSMIVTGYRDHDVTPELWRRIAAVYDDLCMTPGDSTRSRRRAAANGWPSPLAWDDIDRDDKPQGTDLTHRTNDINATRAHELEHLAFMGETLDSACVRLGTDRDTLWRWCNRHGHLDLYAALGERGGRRRENQYTRGAA